MMTSKPNTADKTSATNFNAEELGKAIISAYEKSLPMMHKYMDSHTPSNMANAPIDPYNLREGVMEYWSYFAQNPQALVRSQMDFWTKWTQLCEQSTKKFMGEEAQTLYHPQKGDRRWRDDSWQESALFDFIKQSYLMTSQWAQQSIQDSEHLSDTEKKKLDFHTKQFLDAVAPSNFALTNPQVIKETISSGGENLVKGMKNLINDLERGNGELKISMTDYNAFKVGENLAITEGAVVFENRLMQLIQYKPTTKQVSKTPLLIIPPWINKYYILDMREDNSFIKWLVDQGHTVFITSWSNPDSSHADINFDDYMELGLLEALSAIEDITGEKSTNVIGYCIGGTLLSATMSYLKKHKQESRIETATFLTTLLDFEESGDMKILIDDAQIQSIDHHMSAKGYLEADSLQHTFAMLRSNDLIWSFVINNYLLGKEPFPFDLLYWNSDSTNLPRTMHKYYLQNMYRDNKLIQANELEFKNTPIDLSDINQPCYFLSAREDHIAPWLATYQGINLLTNAKSRFTLASSGHIAGVVNPPAAEKYCHWTSDKTPESPDEWLDGAKENKGSWWPNWQKWITKQTAEKISARKKLGSTKYKPTEPAPGSYVKP